MVILPSIDLREGKVVRLKQGDYAQQLNYDVDPRKTAEDFAATGAKWMHVIDLDGAKQGRPVQTDLIREIIRGSGLKIEVGGGVREQSHIETLLSLGVHRVVVGTRAIEDWTWFTALVKLPAMHGRIVLALDAKDGMVATRGWTETTGRAAVDVARDVSGWPLGAILYTDVAKDGMLGGPNFEQTRLLAESTDVPVIASGGVGSIAHIHQLLKLPVWGAIVGRSLYEGKVDLAAAIKDSGEQR